MKFSMITANKRTAVLIAIVFGIALISRLCAVILFPQFAWDSGEYVLLAQNLLHHQNFTYDGHTPVDSRAPLYPAFIAFIFYFSGDSVSYVRIVQAFLDTLTCMVLFYLTFLLWDSVFIAIISMSIASVHPSLIGSSTFILSETLTTFLITCSVFFLVYALKYTQYRYVIIGGFILGLATLCRPVTLIYPLFIALLCFPITFHNKNILRVIIILISIFALTLLPWIARNAYNFKRFIPVSSNLGGNLYIGSSEEWNGTYNPEIMNIRHKIASQFYPNHIGHFYVDNHLKKEALERIKQSPFTYIKLCIKKVFQFWGRIPGEIETLQGKAILKRIIYIYHYVLLILFIVGSILTIKKISSNILLLFPLSIIIYFTGIHAALVALPRYRIPVMPLVIIFASYSLHYIFRRFQRDNAARTSTAL